MGGSRYGTAGTSAIYANRRVGGLVPSPPITGLAPLMCNSHDKDRVRQDLVNHGVREAADQQPPKSSVAGRSQVRGLTSPSEAPADFHKECFTKTPQLCFIKPSCGAKLGLGKRMNP